MPWSNLQKVGTTGPTGVETDVVAELGMGLFHPNLVGVTLTQCYHPMRPAGYPIRNSPGHMLQPGMTVQAGATLWLLKPEADALVAAGGATYSDMPPPVGQVPQPPPDPLLRTPPPTLDDGFHRLGALSSRAGTGIWPVSALMLPSPVRLTMRP
jgi:hypothetical protein